MTPVSTGRSSTTFPRSRKETDFLIIEIKFAWSARTSNGPWSLYDESESTFPSYKTPPRSRMTTASFSSIFSGVVYAMLKIISILFFNLLCAPDIAEFVFRNRIVLSFQNRFFDFERCLQGNELAFKIRLIFDDVKILREKISNFPRALVEHSIFRRELRFADQRHDALQCLRPFKQNSDLARDFIMEFPGGTRIQRR